MGFQFEHALFPCVCSRLFLIWHMFKHGVGPTIGVESWSSSYLHDWHPETIAKCPAKFLIEGVHDGNYHVEGNAELIINKVN